MLSRKGADAICHGCTGKGNDQVRFELAIHAFAPQMDIIAPWRFWELNSREKEIAYAEAHNIPLKINQETNYSKDKNLWHLSHEGLDLEDPCQRGSDTNKPGFLELGVSPEMAPDKPTYVTIHFEKGVPTAVDGEKLDSVDLIEKLNKLGGENGIGILDIVENRLVGMKSRGVYETPGGSILYAGARRSSRRSPSTRRPRTTRRRSASSSASWSTTASGIRRCARRCPHSSTPRRRPLPAT